MPALFMIPAIILCLIALAGCAVDVNGYRAKGGSTGSIRQVTDPARRAVTSAAEAHGVDPAIALAVMQVESGGRCAVRSAHGAAGVMQVLPATARSVGVHGPLTDCATGAEAGVRYLAESIRLHCAPGLPGSQPQSCCAGISSFNHGIGIRRCTAYGQRVLRLAGRVSS